MATIPVLTQIQNLGSASLPVVPATNLTVLSQNGVARKVTVNDLINGAHPPNLTVDYLTVIYNATVGGTLGVTGASTFGSTVGITGNTTVGGTFGATGASTFGSTVGITGNTTVGGTLGVTGAATLSSTLAVTGDVSVNTNKFNVTASNGNTSVAGNITVGTLSAVAGGSKFGRFGYDATAYLVDMQSAGTNAAGSGYGVLKVQQQVTHTGSASDASGALGSLYGTISTAGSPRTDYYAVAALNTISATRDPLGPATGSQHGAIYTHCVKNLPGGGIGSSVMADGWVQWWVMSDRTGLPSSQGGAQVGVEFDWDGNNEDDGILRFARQVVLKTYLKNATASNPFEVTYGDYWNSTTGGVDDAFFNVVSAYYAGWTVAAIDLSQGTGARANPYVGATNYAVDIKMRDGGKLAFNGDGQTGSYLTHGSSQLQYWSGGTNTLTLSDAGSVFAATSVISPRLQVSTSTNTAINRSWTGSTSPLSYAAFYETYTPSGIPTSGTVAYNYIAINGDNVDGTAVAATAPTGFSLFHNIGGMTMKAGRIAHKVVLTQTSAMAADAAGGPLGGHFIAASAQTSVAYSDGGTGLTDANARGSAYAFYPQCNFGATATNWVGQFGFELDMKAVAGSSMVHKIGQMVVLTQGDAVQGAEDDIGFSFNGDDDVPGWKVMFGLGRHIASMVLDPTGTIMAVIPRYNATTRNNVASRGIDLRMIDFTDAPFSASAGGYEVAGDGTVSVGGLQITPTTTGVKLTMSRQVASIASIASTLTGYQANQLLYDNINGIVNVDTVDGSGNVTAVSFVSGKEAWSASPPANPVGLSGGSHAGIADTGVTLNYTWTAVTDITIGDSGDKIAFYGATPRAQQTVTGAKGGNVALANLLTALANLGIIVDSTT